MEKIEIREKHLNNDLSALIQQYKTVSVEYSQIRNAIQTNDAEKMDLDQQLKKVEHNLENVKIQMEQRGNTMSDGSESHELSSFWLRNRSEFSFFLTNRSTD